jgi:hypothetical protein
MTGVDESRLQQWAATMAGHDTAKIRVAHADSVAAVEEIGLLRWEERE